MLPLVPLLQLDHLIHSCVSAIEFAERLVEIVYHGPKSCGVGSGLVVGVGTTLAGGADRVVSGGIDVYCNESL